jgi:hypothetical protein
MELRSPALFAYVFAPVGKDGSPALGAAWEAVGRLGMTEPIDGLSAPAALGEVPRTPVAEFGLLAAARRPDDVGQHQAYAFAYHDVTGVVVCLAPDQGDASAWPELLAEWNAASPPPDADVLGSALVLVGLAERGTGDAEPPAVEGRPWDSGTRTEGRITVWGAAGEPRLLALIGAPDREADVDRWAWWAGETRLPGLGLYLLHAAKLRFEGDVYRAQVGGLHDALEELDDEIATLTGVLAGDHRRPLTAERLQDAERRLVEAEVRLAGVTGTSTSLGDLGRTVRIARHNMGALVPAPARGEPDTDSPFSRDLEVADWLEEQVEHDVGYAASARERADRVRDLLALRLSHAAERRMQEQNYLLLLQTALLSALIAGVTAFGVLREFSGIEKELQLALVAVAVSFALALPLLLVHAYARYRWFDRVAAVLLGASLGWLITAAAWVVFTDPNEAAPAWAAVPAAIALGILALALTRLQDRWISKHR